MANLNTNQSVPNLGSISQGNVTTESAFPTVTGGSTRATLVYNNPGPSSASALLTTTASLEGRIIRVRLATRVTTGTSSTYISKIYWWNQVNTNLTTFTNDIAIASLTTAAIATATEMVVLQADLVWDAKSQRIVGAFNSQADITYTAYATLTNPVTAVVTAANAFQFFATGTFGTTSANNAVVLTDFSIDQV